jgi:hypothetical protein
MMESVNVVVDDILERKENLTEDEDDDLDKSNDDSKNSSPGKDVTTSGPTSDPLGVNEPVFPENLTPNKGPSIRIQKMHPQDNIIGSATEGVLTRSRKLIANACFISKVGPKNVKEA